MTAKKNQVLCLVHVPDSRYNVTIFSELCVLEELDFSVNKVLAAAATLNDDMVLKLNWQIEWLTKSSVDGQHNVPHVVIVVDQGFLCSKKRRSFIFCWVVYTQKSGWIYSIFQSIGRRKNYPWSFWEINLKGIWRGFRIQFESENCSSKNHSLF